MAKTTAANAAVGAAAPTTPTPPAKATKPAKPLHHQPTPPRARDAYTGLGGTYTRDPATGLRTPVKPAAAPPAAAGADDTAAA